MPNYWQRDALLDFYTDVADSPVDIVYLGETVCTKRRSLRLDAWLGLADELAAAGKQVVLSSLALIEAESELKTLRRLSGNGRFPVEANDMAAVQQLAGRVPFVAGPFVNIYNHRTLDVLARLGLQRWCMPVELSRDTLAAVQAQRPAGVETEIYAWGRLPLALSARCFTARAHGLPKDDCKFRCLDYPDGMLLETQDARRLLYLNWDPDAVGVDVYAATRTRQHAGTRRRYRAHRPAVPAHTGRGPDIRRRAGRIAGQWRRRPRTCRLHAVRALRRVLAGAPAWPGTTDPNP